MTKGSGHTTRTPAVLAGAAIVVVVIVALLATAIVLIATSSNTDSPAVRSRERSAANVTPTTASPVGEIAALRVADAHDEGYDRDQFGDWVDADRDCQDTRAEVLALESRVSVTFSTPAACSVATGEWIDPWSGEVTTSARALDVDHTVPLANAWRSGAWAWSPERRVAFANDLADAGHLIAIPSGENRSKSDRGPEQWRPPAITSWCAYAQLWTSIKARWDLSATPAEWKALQEMAATC